MVVKMFKKILTRKKAPVSNRKYTKKNTKKKSKKGGARSGNLKLVENYRYQQIPGSLVMNVT